MWSWNFPLDFVLLQKDWALVKAETEHKQKKLRRSTTQKMKFSTEDFSEKSLIKNFIFLCSEVTEKICHVAKYKLRAF